MEAFKPLLAKVATGAALSREEARQAFDDMLSGEVTPAQMGGFLMALRVRGETVDEITGAVSAMREKMLRVAAPAGAMDIVGTGGDGSGTWNVSTLAALIVAAGGVPVAKHGNRAASSKSGTAGVLGALGVKVGMNPAQVSTCIDKAGIAFMMAQTHHAAMRHVGPARVELGTRTIFNILGPLSNPAGAKRQMTGAFALSWLEPMAEVLRNTGSERAWLVHGSDGLDELTVTGPTTVVELSEGAIHRFEVTPEDAGLPRHPAQALKGGDPETNARALREVLKGARNAYRDIAVLNAAASFVVAERAPNLKEGARLAQLMLDTGAAAKTLDNLVKHSNSEPAA